MKEALERALQVLEYWDVQGGLHQPTEEAITALRLAIDVQNMASESTYKAALAQPAQEPVAWWNDTGTHIDLNVSGRGTPLYTTPPQRTWVGLTDEERDAITDKVIGFNSCCGWEDDYAKTIEAKLKELNT